MTVALPVRIAGVGKYLPERVVANAELEISMGLSAGWIFKRTGVLERRYASHETTVSQAVAAAQVALERAGVRLDEINAIIGASSTPQQAIPCTAALVQAALGAPDGGSACWDVNATCLSFLFALHSAAQTIALGMYETVLVFSSEIASPSLNPTEPESAALFGDAAAAIVLRRDSTASSLVYGARFQTFASSAHLTRLSGGGTLHRPQFTHENPELNLFQMNGPAIFRHALQHMGPFMTGFLQGVGWQIPDVDALVPHQASKHGVEQVSRRLGFQPRQVMTNLATRGNCVAASIPLALCEAMESGQIGRGDRVVLAGTAAGLTLGALALKI